METGAQALYEIVEEFIGYLFKIISAFLALFGFDPTKKDEATTEPTSGSEA